MEAIICNAGKGTRLGTISVPKCLIRDENSGKSILWYQLDALKEVNLITRVIIVVRENNTSIAAEVAAIKDRFDFEIVLAYISDSSNTGIIDSIKLGYSFLSPDCASVLKLDGDVCILYKEKFAEDVRDAISDNSNIPLLFSYHTDKIENSPIIYQRKNSELRQLATKSTELLSSNFTYGTDRDGCFPIQWSYIDYWPRTNLEEILYSKTYNSCGVSTDKLMYRLNLAFLNKVFNAENIIPIEPCYEVDDQEDLEILKEACDSYSKELTATALTWWERLNKYPEFNEDKKARTLVDSKFILGTLKLIGARSIIEIGAGNGQLAKALLANNYKNTFFDTLTLVEPNKHFCKEMAKNYTLGRLCNIFPNSWGNLSQEHSDQFDLAILFGVIQYQLNDNDLINLLANHTPAQAVLIKASEPDTSKYDRLTVNEWSKNLNGKYISIYRSLSDTCKILRGAGYRIVTTSAKMYSKNDDSKFGNRTYLIYAERC